MKKHFQSIDLFRNSIIRVTSEVLPEGSREKRETGTPQTAGPVTKKSFERSRMCACLLASCARCSRSVLTRLRSGALQHIFLLLSLLAFIAVGCADKNEHQIYTCPMHQQIQREKPGDCPICGMKLVPVQKKSQEHHSEEKNTFIISSERQQLIGLKTATAAFQLFLKTISTVGRVAFDPELAAAQQEFVEISQNIPSLKHAARSNLKARGMSNEEIRELEKKKTVSSNLFLPENSGAVWVYATLFQNEMDLIKVGTQARITLKTEAPQVFDGVVRNVDPILDATTRSARARIFVANAGGILRPDAYVNVELSIDLGSKLVIPKSAVIDTGVRKIAFVINNGTQFVERDVVTSAEAEDRVAIESGVNEGEIVATSATFLIDSESQLKAAISGMGGHKH